MKPGTRLKSAACDTEVMVIRCGTGSIECGGAPMGEARAAEREPLPGGTLRGNSFAALVAPPIREAATVFVNGRRVKLN